MVSLCGRLMRAIKATKMLKNAARTTIAANRNRAEMSLRRNSGFLAGLSGTRRMIASEI
jgi:hypothetical protein